MNTPLPTVADLMEEAMRLSRRLEALTDEQYRNATRLAEATSDYEDQEAQAWKDVRAEMGIRDDDGERRLSKDYEAETHDRVKGQARTVARLKAEDKALDNAGRNLRQQLSALQSVSATVRDELKLAGVPT